MVNKRYKKLNVVFDLDNTLICSLTPNEIEKNNNAFIKTYEKANINKNKTFIRMKNKNYCYDMKENGKTHYTVFERPGLQNFLDYIFKNYDVSVWTAASYDYASFIVENIILANNKNRRLKMFLHSKNCDESQKIYNKKTPKQLAYIYHFKNFNNCNTIIVDDLYEVISANFNNVVDAKYFDVLEESKNKEEEEKNKLESIKQEIDALSSILIENGCIRK
jgi:hypothetical protein